MVARKPQQARSQTRRDGLLKAAAELIAEGGIDAVTHRAVATRAGLPPSTTGYFFDSIDDLTAEALRVYTERAVAEYVELRRSAIQDDGGDSDRLIRAVARRRSAPEEALSQVSLYLEANRNLKLRVAVTNALDGYRHFAAESLAAVGLPRAEAVGPAFVALFDGFTLHELARPDAPKSDEGLIEAVDALLVGFLLDEEERRAIKSRLLAMPDQQAV